ncbi:thioesterase II family protein [Kibdelosporangium philippinense]|uniref:thioesterase II family protein n=1 Tax=Kibdelosporangium philippinense TaxID=211113 RepID=UPI0035EE7D56
MKVVSLRCRTRRPFAETRVVCLPHAGGSASFFNQWGPRLPARTELWAVQYPGREDRIDDPPAAQVVSLAAEIAEEAAGLTGLPTILFGHSFGALVAYEVARLLEHRYHRPVAGLVVSGRRPPMDPAEGSVHVRTDDGLVDELERLGGPGAAVLGDPVLRSVFLPAVRSDYRLSESYRHRAGSALSCPVLALIGREDPEVDARQAAGWAQCTTGPFELDSLPGGHFYLIEHQADVLSRLARIGEPL